jgi:hypothetical protein
MNALAIRQWNNQGIRIRPVDRYVSLTDMAQATNKLFADWKRLNSTTEYLETLSSVMGILITDLVQITQGGIPEEQGTWGHPKVAIRFAQWCSDGFAVQVDCWIDELLTTGRVKLNQSPSTLPTQAELTAMLAQETVNLEKKVHALEKTVAEQEQMLAKLKEKTEVGAEPVAPAPQTSKELLRFETEKLKLEVEKERTRRLEMTIEDKKLGRRQPYQPLPESTPDQKQRLREVVLAIAKKNGSLTASQAKKPFGNCGK